MPTAQRPDFPAIPHYRLRIAHWGLGLGDWERDRPDHRRRRPAERSLRLLSSGSRRDPLKITPKTRACEG